LIDALVIDEADAPADLGPDVRSVATHTLMTDPEAARRLAATALDAAGAHA